MYWGVQRYRKRLFAIFILSDWNFNHYLVIFGSWLTKNPIILSIWTRNSHKYAALLISMFKIPFGCLYNVHSQSLSHSGIFKRKKSEFILVSFCELSINLRSVDFQSQHLSTNKCIILSCLRKKNRYCNQMKRGQKTVSKLSIYQRNSENLSIPKKFRWIPSAIQIEPIKASIERSASMECGASSVRRFLLRYKNCWIIWDHFITWIQNHLSFEVKWILSWKQNNTIFFLLFKQTNA